MGCGDYLIRLWTRPTREEGTLEKIRRLAGRLTTPQREAVLNFITELIEEEDREDYPASEK